MKQALISTALLFILFASCKNNEHSARGLSSTEAIQSFEIADGFQIELVAAEPLVADPVAMELDESGNIYVVEMHGYPLDRSGTGKIKKLTDTDNDGIPDKSTVFADSLGLPNGIMRWKKGFLITDVPDVIYLEDSDGDGKADIRKKILTGFAVSNPQHDANTPLLGIDNWLYIAHEGEVTPKVFVKEFGDVGTDIEFVGKNGAATLPRNANGRNVRFKPDSYELEMLSGDGQYGQTFDPWGHHILTMNYKHLFQEVIDSRYLQNNPNLLVVDALQNLPDHGDAAEVYPITKNPLHQLLTDVGVITSSCGVTWYQGGLFPDSFNHATFIAEPVHNLIHADHIMDNGASFTASRIYHNKEFLASTDSWFRPVQFYIGPDGALYLIDYYRQIIEHPEWMSDEVNKSGALYNGSDKGRIYRITPKNSPKMNWCGKLELGKSSTKQLIQMLASKNIWWRRNAQRLLVDKKDSSSASLLKNLIDTTSYPQAIVHALWTLEGINLTDATVLSKLLNHETPGVRENAIRLLEIHRKDFPGIEAALVNLKDDPSPKVRFQLLCTLGFFTSNDAAAARREILFRDFDDHWVQIAALSSSYQKELDLITSASKSSNIKKSEGAKSFFNTSAGIIGLSKNTADIKRLIALCTKQFDANSAWWQAECLDGLRKGLNYSKPGGENFDNERSALLTLFRPETPAALRNASAKLLKELKLSAKSDQVLQQAQKVAFDKQANTEYRQDALLLLSTDPKKVGGGMYKSLINPEEPESIQTIAINSYIQQSDTVATREIIQLWSTLTPAVRNVAVDNFLKSPSHMNLLLDAVEKKQIQPSTIGWGRMVELMNNDDVPVKNRARKLLSGQAVDQDELFKKYSDALTANGDRQKGSAVFQKNCSICHQIGGSNGKAFGPDLASIRNRDAQFIMADILNPNRSIADGYELWIVETNDGKKINGIISSETSSTITIREAAGNQSTIPRSAIKNIEAGSTSAMPQGLQSNITVSEMADLLAFLKRPQ